VDRIGHISSEIASRLAKREVTRSGLDPAAVQLGTGQRGLRERAAAEPHHEADDHNEGRDATGHVLLLRANQLALRFTVLC